MAGGPPPRARLSLWFGGVKRFRDISSVGWRLPAVFHDRLTPANTQLRTADAEPIQVKILSHFPPGRDRQGFQTNLHPPSTHRYAQRLRNRNLGSCFSLEVVVDTTTIEILSHFPPGRDRQGFQTNLHPPSTHRYAQRLRNRNLGSCFSLEVVVDTTTIDEPFRGCSKR